MKKIVIILLMLLSSNVIFAKEDDVVDRMLRYDALHRLFNGCMSPLGIEEINYMESVYRYWDFDSFADYIVQEISKFPGIKPEECVIDGISRTLVLPLTGVESNTGGVPAAKLKLSFESDGSEQDRWLAVSYEIKDDAKSLEYLRHQCLDLLEGLSKVEFNGNEAYEGAYDFIYTAIPEGDSLWFSCHMPVSPRKWYNVNAGYCPDTSYDKLPKSAPCNKGKEPFNEFLRKFNKSKEFRVSRRGFSDKASHADFENGHPLPVQFTFSEFVLEALDDSGLLPLRGHYDYKEYKSETDIGSEEYAESCGQWFYPTENSVIYSGWNMSSEFGEDDCSIVILFERIEDEWCTTATWHSGNRLNERVLQIFNEKTGN